MNLTAQNAAIVVDSTADFPDAHDRYPNWRVVPLYVRFGEQRPCARLIGDVATHRCDADNPERLINDQGTRDRHDDGQLVPLSGRQIHVDREAQAVLRSESGRHAALVGSEAGRPLAHPGCGKISL